jgi:hypothetical protein
MQNDSSPLAIRCHRCYVHWVLCRRNIYLQIFEHIQRRTLPGKPTSTDEKFQTFKSLLLSFVQPW